MFFVHAVITLKVLNISSSDVHTILYTGIRCLIHFAPFHPFNVNLLLFGCTEYDYETNCKIFLSVHTYIKDTKRFEKNRQASRVHTSVGSTNSFCPTHTNTIFLIIVSFLVHSTIYL